MSKDAPWAPPIVSLNGGTVGHLLCWELIEVSGSWQAWVSWIQQSGGRYIHKVVSVGASQVLPLEEPESYSRVPRRVRGRDGIVRLWSGEAG